MKNIIGYWLYCSMFCKQLLLLLLVLQTLHSFGQTYPYKQFTTNNGLINNRCGNVSQDSAGYIWITSDNGISNYDGRKFTFFPGKNATYYFAHTNTINMYKGQCVFATNGEGVALGLGNKLSFYVPPGTSTDQITYGLMINDSSTLIARIYANDLEMISCNRKTIIKLPPEISQKMKSFLMFVKDMEGNIWIGTDAGVCVYKKGNFNDPYILPALLGKYCNVLKADFEGNIFIASQHDVYKIFREHLKDVNQARPVKFATHKEEITAMGFSRNGDILVSDLPSGIAIYNKALQLHKKITKHGLPDVVLWDIFVDREENIWFATQNGVYRFSNFSFVNYTPSDVSGSPNIMNGVIYNNEFLFSNGRDIFMLKNEEIKKIYHASLIANYDARVLVTPDNSIWLNRLLNFGLSTKRITQAATLENGHLTFMQTNIFDSDEGAAVDIDRSVAINKKDMAFLSHNKKLFLYQDRKIKKVILPTLLDSLNFNAISRGFTDDEIMLAVNKTGLFYCKIENNNETVLLRVIEKIPFGNDVKDDRCTKMIAAKNKHIWLATRNSGIRIFSKSKSNYTLYKTLTEPDISSSMITELMQDSMGSVWVGSNKGVDKISMAPQNNFTINKGLYNNLMNGSLVYFIKEHNSKLHIGTTGSLSTIDIHAKLSSILPFVHISHLTVNNDNADSLLPTGSHIFSPNQNNLTFEFVSPTFIDEQATEYQYQLQGIDKDWSTAAGNYIIAYSQLPAGDYTFKVRAKNANSVWSLSDATFSFTIKKPFYKHWLFFLLCGAAIVGVSYWLYRQKMNRLIAVVKVVDLTEGAYTERELMMVKVRAVGKEREEMKRMADIFRGRIIDVTEKSYTIELTGDQGKNDAFLEAIDRSAILETVRTGSSGIGRGERILRV